jgi:hypothetical protein
MPAQVRTADDVTGRIAVAVESVDPENYADLTYRDAGSVIQPDLMGWQIEHLRLDPVFSGCRQASADRVACQLTYGTEYFYSVVLGYNVTGSITVNVFDDGSFAITEWPFPEEVKTVERELREWIRVTHPEAESEMFGTDAYGVFKFTERAAELHADYLDEYVASLGA